MHQSKLIVRSIRDLMAGSFIDYSMSVITERALPDLRDGFKPVHRRILYAMRELGNDYNKLYKKSARIVGDVMGKYHPHGDSSIYGATVRMAQPFSMNHPLVDGQGNFGSIDGDNAAAMRYTEVRLTRLAGEMFADLHKDTIPWLKNYDGSGVEPEVLPVPYPNLLVNGGEGIAVGMATSIPPHNLAAVCDATLALILDPSTSSSAICEIIKAPDFPTGAIVHGVGGFADAVETGRGRLKIRGVWHEEDRGRGLKSIVIDELPYQVNKAMLVVKVAELVREKRIEGITDISDESNKDGIRVVIAIKKDESAEVIFSSLCSLTDLEVSVNYNCVVLDRGRPVLLGLRDILVKWIEFREDVVLKRHIFDRKQALAKLHILNGYLLAMGMMDETIRVIRASKNGEEAKESLFALLSVDEVQADAILALRLQKLTGMELDGINAEHADYTSRVAGLTEIIESPALIRGIICEELLDIKARYGKPRMSEIRHDLSDITREDMIPREDVVIVLTKNGYVKRMPASSLAAQNRGTRGKRSIEVGDGDEVSAIYEANTHDTIFVFDQEGQVYSCKGYQIPESGLTSKGRHIKNVIDGFDKEIAAIVRVPSDMDSPSIVIVTSDGTIKRSSLDVYTGAGRKGGVKGITLDGNIIVNAFLASDVQQVMMIASTGKTIRFNLDDLREIGRTGQGVRGMKISEGDRVVGALVIDADSLDQMICIGANGVGKRTPVADFETQARGGTGVYAFKANEKTGMLVAAFGADEGQDIVMLSSNGVSNRVAVKDIRETNRVASGSRLINLDEGQSLVSVTTVVRVEADEESALAEMDLPSKTEPSQE